MKYYTLFLNVFIAAFCLLSCKSKKSEPADSPKIEYITSGAFRYQKFNNDSFPDPVGYVNDFENILSESEERILDTLINDF